MISLLPSFHVRRYSPCAWEYHSPEQKVWRPMPNSLVQDTYMLSADTHRGIQVGLSILLSSFIPPQCQAAAAIEITKRIEISILRIKPYPFPALLIFPVPLRPCPGRP